MLVECVRLVILGIHDQRIDGERLSGLEYTAEGIEQRIFSKPLPLA